jgi:hypothetical protein
MLKPLSLLFVLATIGFAQSFRFGVEGGVPLTNPFATHTITVSPVGVPTGPLNYSALTKRYTVGATAELDLPFHLAVKADVLYKRLDFNGASSPPEGTISATHSNSFEFPLLGKYGVSKLGPLQPYIEGGVAFRFLQGVSQTSRVNCATCTDLLRQTSHPLELSHTSPRASRLAPGWSSASCWPAFSERSATPAGPPMRSPLRTAA